MGFFNRLLDFGDREQVRTYVYRICVGLEQIEKATSISDIKGLSIALRKEIQDMIMVATKLTGESINSLDVKVNGCKMPFLRFIDKLEYESAKIVAKGGCSII